MPIRLVQENGETISLDATSVDIVVERQVSNFGIPFFDAKKMGIDLNQASVSIEVQGVFADETGQEESAQSQAIIDFYQPQALLSDDLFAGKGGGMSDKEKSIYNQKKKSTDQTGRGSKETVSGQGKGGGVGNSGTALVIPALHSITTDNWDTRYIDLPVAYWVEQNQVLDNPSKTNLQLWLKGENYSDGTWTDASGFARNATQSNSANKPFAVENGVNGNEYVFFAGSNDFLEIPFDSALNSKEFTIFIVASSNSSNDKPILDSETDGYGLSLQASGLSSIASSKFTARWVDGGGPDSKDSSAFVIGLNRFDAGIFAYTMEDTDSDNTSDKVNIFFNGANVGTEAFGVDYTPATSGALRIGYDGSNYFKGSIYEILIYNTVLSDEDRQNVEGYLARKYGLNLIMGKYKGTGRYSNQTEHIRVVFDNQMIGSKVEPYGFLNQRRRATTQQAINSMRLNHPGSAPPNTLVSTLTVDGDPRTWFETSNPRRHRITFSASEGGYPVRQTSGGDDYHGEVVSVTSNTITVHFNKTGGTHADNDFIFIEPVDYGRASLIGTDVAPVWVLPIRNADTYIKGIISEEAIGPSHPDFQDTSVRNAADHGADLTRTDEYITFLLSKALTSTYAQLGRDIDSAGSTPTLNNIYTTSISESYHGHNARLTITQKYATSLGQKNKIHTNLSAGLIPVIQDFSGGKAGKQVKSAGDKVQDLFGILANSNNFLNIQNSKSELLDSIIDATTGFVQQEMYDEDYQGDYIRGIQIPYNTLATKGDDTLDTEVAQRNFFLTTTNARTSDKMSTANDRHASRAFSHTAEGHEKNGISGLVSDFNVNRDAAMKAYEFSLVFIAADIIL